MMCTAQALTTQKKIQGVSEGSWEGVGSLVAGGEAFFLAKDAFGHDDGNRAIVAGYFC